MCELALKNLDWRPFDVSHKQKLDVLAVNFKIWDKSFMWKKKIVSYMKI